MKNKNQTTIGYQGVEFSNNYFAALKFIERKNFNTHPILKPLVSSKRVIDALKKGDIDYGVCASYNTIGGVVPETFKEITNTPVELLDTLSLPIHHCLFSKTKLETNELKQIYSHHQAISQCSKFLNENCKNATINQHEDTAKAAVDLSNGTLEENGTAVICSKQAGESCGLYLIAEKIENTSDNQTEFIFLKMRNDKQFKKPLRDFFSLLLFAFFTDKIFGVVSKLIVTGIIFFFLSYLVPRFKIDTMKATKYIVAFLSFFYITLSSPKVKQSFKRSYILGYYKYYSTPGTTEHEKEIKQNYSVPRLVKISTLKNEVTLTGYSAGNTSETFVGKNVSFSMLGEKNGYMTYEYTNSDLCNYTKLKGIAKLAWSNKRSAQRVLSMNGWYAGRSTGDNGNMQFMRISEEEFNRLQHLEFLEKKV